MHGRRLVLGDEHLPIALGVDDLCRHTMIFGSSGSGKTTRGFNPIFAAMLERLDAGAFVIAPKPEAAREALAIAERVGRRAVLVEPGGDAGFDLFCGEPDVDAAAFRDALGRVAPDQQSNVEAALARVKHSLTIVGAAGSQYYTFEHLTGYCFDDEFAATMRIHAGERLRYLPHESEAAWAIREAFAYEDVRYFRFSNEIRAAIRFSLSQFLEPLRDARLAKTFARKRNLVDLETVFDGAVIVLHVPRDRYDRAAEAIYALAKRRFFTALAKRRSDPALDQHRPVVFGVDEYQLCASESDVRSLGVIRSAGCMVLATTHGVSSLYSVLPRAQADAALQNFTQKLFFKTDDYETLALLERATHYSPNRLEPSALFSMHRNQALAHVTAGDVSHDAVLTMHPLFAGEDYLHDRLESVA
ncbi:MAG: type IV secretory system conjugative DNA transfer family protein [Candidatus Eremiobacteraeota bacterium]|nr:type IV secretory system conjugative DNA transfer family protein [Candidatus Eremiobacteraeota bacterium]